MSEVIFTATAKKSLEKLNKSGRRYDKFFYSQLESLKQGEIIGSKIESIDTGGKDVPKRYYFRLGLGMRCFYEIYNNTVTILDIVRREDLKSARKWH